MNDQLTPDFVKTYRFYYLQARKHKDAIVRSSSILILKGMRLGAIKQGLDTSPINNLDADLDNIDMSNQGA